MRFCREAIECNDGFAVSVQASEYHYCIPRENTGPYTHVEVGFPTEKPNDAMMQYAEDPENPKDTVYAYVPVEIVWELLQMHGGPKEHQEFLGA